MCFLIVPESDWPSVLVVDWPRERERERERERLGVISLQNHVHSVDVRATID